ncbi:MAG: hypothetical protein M1827_003476 [Pycnora praestabilis]|nr:MAG: hypothetical protein M1827_003476 [Pycnora praestabilis]
MNYIAKDSPAKECTFLELPLELRNQIYSLILPDTIMIRNGSIAWQRGHTALLVANSQIYNEGLEYTYSRSTFNINVAWDGITFEYKWLLPSGFVPNRTYQFPDILPRRNLRRIRNYRFIIHHVDSYTGMVKYNYGGRGLTQGLREQVKKLCDLLREGHLLHKVEIVLVDGNGNLKLGQNVLAPFTQLRNVRQATVSGAVTAEYAKDLKSTMEGSAGEPLPPFSRLPLELRQEIYRYVLRWSNFTDHFDHAIWYPKSTYNKEYQNTLHYPRSVNMLKLNKQIHDKAAAVLHGENVFGIGSTLRKWNPSIRSSLR